MSAAIALTVRELRRFVRQPSRVIGTIGTPLIFWIVAASGLSGSFAYPVPTAAATQPPDAGGLSYAAFLLPGMVTMVVVFSTIFAAISLIQDRQAGFLQSVIVSATPTWAIVASKVLGGTLVSLLQAALLLLASPLIGLQPGADGFAGALAAAAMTSAAVIGLGLACAWWINSTSGFHGVMNTLLMPMWLLSGSIFPVEGASRWLAFVMNANPLSWCTRAIACSIRGDPSSAGWAWAGSAGFAIVSCALAAIVMARRSTSAGAGGNE